MFQQSVGLGSLPEPIKHRRRGVQIEITAPKVPTYDAVCASSAIGCDKLIELSGYMRDPGGATNTQCVFLCLSTLSRGFTVS